MKFNRRVEAFNPNYSDPLVIEMTRVIENMHGIISAEMRVKSKTETRVLLKDDMEKFQDLVRKRFGFKVKLKPAPGFLAVRIPVPKSTSGVRNYRSMYREVKELLSKGTCKPKDIQEYLDKCDKLDRWLHLKAVKVDLNYLHISGLPDEFEPVIYFNLKSMIRADMNPREVMAGFLHEIGHVFTFIAFAYRCRTKRLTLEQSIQDYSEMAKKGNSYLLAYEQAFQDKQYRNQNPNNPLVVISVTKSIIADAEDALKVGNGKDKEYMADAFATSFGFGRELSSTIRKIKKRSETTVFDLSIVTLIIMAVYTLVVAITLVVFTFTLLFSPIVLPFFATYLCGLLLGVGIYLSIVMFGTIVMAMFGHNPEEKDYGTSTSRIENIRRNCIANLTKLVNEKGDPEQIADLVEQIEAIKEDKKSLKEKVGPSCIDKLVDFFMGVSTDYIFTKEVVEFNDTIEELLHNELHFQKEKLKTVLK